MLQIGYKLCSEERSAIELVRDAVDAERAGFAFAAISDHFHPWIDEQGESPFVWSVLGALATCTSRIRVGTAVTCPSIRMHPAIVAQAAATTACLLPGRSFLGVGTGENLNEHVVGEGWPNAATRRSMLADAVAAIRELWDGGMVSIEGRHVRIDTARLYSLPTQPPPIYVAAGGSEAADLAASIGDGLICTAPAADLVDRFERAGGAGPRLAEMLVCVDASEARAWEVALERWPLPGIPGELSSELPLPRHFEQAASVVDRGDLMGSIVVGPDPRRYVEAIARYRDAGFDRVFLHQVGHDQDGFFAFAAQELLPLVRRSLTAAA